MSRISWLHSRSQSYRADFKVWHFPFIIKIFIKLSAHRNAGREEIFFPSKLFSFRAPICVVRKQERRLSRALHDRTSFEMNNQTRIRHKNAVNTCACLAIPKFVFELKSRSNVLARMKVFLPHAWSRLRRCWCLHRFLLHFLIPRSHTETRLRRTWIHTNSRV